MNTISAKKSLNAIKVGLKEGEIARKSLIKEKLLLHNFYVIKNDEYIFFPIADDYYKYSSLKWEIIQKEFAEKPKVSSFQDQLEEILPFALHSSIPTSYDRIGNTILVKLDYEVYDYKEKIGQVIKDTLQVDAVYMKTGETSSIYRITKWIILAGTDKPLINHKMNGLRFQLNINDVYFNPRLGIEYKRVSEICQDNWIIIDMFSGIGPLGLTVAALKKVTVYSCDINPKAIVYQKENLELNKNVIKGRVVVLQGDISEKINSFPKADFIFMNLPEGGIDYLELAVMYLKKTGIIHLHQFLQIGNKSSPTEIQEHKTTLEERLFYYEKINELNVTFNVTERVLRDVSPSKSHLVWEITAQNQE